jgi:hypothetical protein
VGHGAKRGWWLPASLFHPQILFPINLTDLTLVQILPEYKENRHSARIPILALAKLTELSRARAHAHAVYPALHPYWGALADRWGHKRAAGGHT